MQGVQDLIQNNVDNLNNVRHKAVRLFRNKEKTYLNVQFEKLETNSAVNILGTCIEALIILRRVSRL